MARNSWLLSVNYGLLQGRVAHYFLGYLAFQVDGRPLPSGLEIWDLR